MKHTEWMHGRDGEKYGVWNTVRKKFQFGICEDTPMLADARLFQRIGDNARKYRFEIRRLPKGEDNEVYTTRIPKILHSKDSGY